MQGMTFLLVLAVSSMGVMSTGRFKPVCWSSLKRAMDDEYHDHDAILREKCPWSTPSERRRFLVARKANANAAVEQLLQHKNWLLDHDLIIETNPTEEQTHLDSSLIPGTEDLDLWNTAVVDVWLLPLYNPAKTINIQLLPRIARFHCNGGYELRTKDGQRILQFFPAQLDWSLASIQIYTAVIALYMYKHLDRHSDETIFILIDVRAGHGWKNPPAFDCIPFIKYLAKILEQNFPERLGACILYPLPWGTESLWKLIRHFIDPVTSNKIRIISGPASRDSPPPNISLGLYVDDATLVRLEENRISSFSL